MRSYKYLKRCKALKETKNNCKKCIFIIFLYYVIFILPSSYAVVLKNWNERKLRVH